MFSIIEISEQIAKKICANPLKKEISLWHADKADSTDINGFYSMQKISKTCSRLLRLVNK
jgi:hypothetical protein